MSKAAPFWRTKTLGEMTTMEWESLCDGCGKCCLHKLEDEDTGEVVHTNVACKLLDLRTARCSDYKHRRAYVPDCLRLTIGTEEANRAVVAALKEFMAS